MCYQQLNEQNNFQQLKISLKLFNQFEGKKELYEVFL